MKFHQYFLTSYGFCLTSFSADKILFRKYVPISFSYISERVHFVFFFAVKVAVVATSTDI